MKAMSPENEITRIKLEYKDHWQRLQNHPGIQRALEDNNPIKLGEMAAMIVHGNYYDGGAAHQASHPVTVHIKDLEPKSFSDVESAKKFIAHRRTLHPALQVYGIYRRGANGTMEMIPE